MKKAGVFVLLGILVIFAVAFSLFAHASPASPISSSCIGGRYTGPNGEKGIDSDKDGWDLQCGDCNDARNDTNPASIFSECDGIDHNCDGIIECENSSLINAYWNANAVSNENVVLSAESYVEGENISFSVYKKNNGSCSDSQNSAININDNSLVSLYHLDGNTLDAKGNNNGQSFGANFTQGKINSAALFNGNSYIRVNDSQSLRLNNSFSVELWFKANSSVDNKNEILLSKGINYEIRYDELTNKLTFYRPRASDVNTTFNSALSIDYQWQQSYFNRFWQIGNTQSLGVGSIDINNDGYDDGIVISKNETGNISRLDVYLGSAYGLSDTPVYTYYLNSEGSGYASIATGNLNNDGYDDIAVSISGGVGTPDMLYVFYGSNNGLIPAWSKTYTNPTSCNDIFFVNTYTNVPFYMGCHLSIAIADINNDGYDDLAVGDKFYNNNAGKVDIFLGSSSGLSSTSLPSLNGGAGCNFGNSIALGNVNRDSYNDLLVGAPFCNTNGSAYLYSGSASGVNPSPIWTGSSLNYNPSQCGDRCYGHDSPWVQYGYSVALGDINNDGYDDVIVGQMSYWSEDSGEFPTNSGTFAIYYVNSSGIPHLPYQNVSYPGDGAVVDWPYFAMTADFNGDGYKEIFQSSPFSDGTYLWTDGGQNGKRGNILRYDPLSQRILRNPCSYWCFNWDYWGSGSAVGAPGGLHDGGDGYSVSAGDFNGDGIQDTISTDWSDSISFTNSPYYNLEIPIPDKTQWHHLAVSNDGNQIKLYLDGILRAFKNVDDDIPIISSPLLIGGDAKNRDFNGEIDEVAIYNKALTQNEVSQHYNSQDTLAANQPISAVTQKKVASQADSSLQILYHFDSNASDSSSNHNDGIINGTNLTTGKFGNAYSFNGASNYIDIPKGNYLSVTAGTVSVWIYPTNTSSGSILKIGGANYPYPSFNLGLSSGKISANIAGGNGGWHINGNTILTPGNWYYITLTHNGVQPEIYINGKQENLTSNTIGNGNLAIFLDQVININYANIGRGDSGYFNGTIDDFAFYNRVLSPKEILDNFDFNKPLSENATPYVASSYWSAEYNPSSCQNQYYFIANSSSSQFMSNLLNVTAGSVNNCNETSPSICTGNPSCFGLTGCSNPFCMSTSYCKPVIFINSPQFTTYNNLTINFNITLDKQGNSCLYSLDDWQTNTSMIKSGNYFTNTSLFTNTSVLNGGKYVVKFYCNDSFGNSAVRSSSFSISRLSLCYKLDNGIYVPTPGLGAKASDCGGCLVDNDCQNIHICQNNTCVLNTTLVSYYPFDNNLNDYSGFGSNATGMGMSAPTSFVPGELGNALRIDSIVAGEPVYAQLSESIDTSITISAWIYEPTPDNDAYIVEVPGYYGLGLDNGKPFGMIGNGTLSLKTNETFSMPNFEWHHLAFVFNGTSKEADIYYDGNLTSSSVLNMTLPLANNGLWMGMNGGFVIDELKVWNYPLAGSQIYQEYSRENETWLAINSCSDLQKMNVTSNNNYYLANDIDCTGWDFGDGGGFMPIGNFSYVYTDAGYRRAVYVWVAHGDSLAKTFDGRNHNIKNLNIKRGTSEVVYGGSAVANYETGLFSSIESTGLVENLFLENLSYTNGTVCGGIAGVNYGRLINVHATSGNISCSGTVANQGYYPSVGGVSAINHGLIVNSSSAANVFYGGSATAYLGGFVGDNSGGQIFSSYSKGNASGNYIYYVGGFAGNAGSYDDLSGRYDPSVIANSYSTGNVYKGIYEGGFVGSNYGFASSGAIGTNINNSYSTGSVATGTKGGFIGYGYGNCTNNFWDIQSSGILNASGTGTTYGTTWALGETTTQMKTRTTFSGWNFGGVWGINPGINNGYPFLTWEHSGYNASDNIFPIFSNYQDNNGSLNGYGIATFNVIVTNSNGTVYLNINGQNYFASNNSNMFNVSLQLVSGVYSYYWGAYGNGSNTLFNFSSVRSYSVGFLSSAQVSLISPANNSISTSPINFIYNVSSSIPIANCSLTATQVIPNEIPVSSSGLVGLWHMNNNWNDALGVSNGTAYGGVGFTSGVFSQAGNFDASPSSYVSIPSNSNFTFGANPFTISFWINPQAYPLSVYRNIISHTNGSVGGWSLSYQSYYFNNFYWVWGSNSIGIGCYLTSNAWQQFAVVYNGATYTFYLNGNACGSPYTLSVNYSALAPLIIGQGANASLDDVAIYNRALSPTEVKALANLQAVYYYNNLSSSVTKNTPQTLSLNLAGGNYTWNVSCLDYANIVGGSTTNNLIVSTTLQKQSISISTDKDSYNTGEKVYLTS